jgi:hypothetical protein
VRQQELAPAAALGGIGIEQGGCVLAVGIQQVAGAGFERQREAQALRQGAQASGLCACQSPRGSRAPTSGVTAAPA